MGYPRSRSRGRRPEYRYEPLGPEGVEQPRQPSRARPIAIFILLAFAIAGLVYSISRYPLTSSKKSCDTIYDGFQCHPEKSRHWGQYSMYYTIPSDIPDEVPHGCHISFAQILSRHGCRDPSSGKQDKYNTTITKLQENVKTFEGKYAFLNEYNFTLGADMLTDLGRQQMVNSGRKFQERYSKLALKEAPFVRASGQYRVVESAEKWIEGYHASDKSNKSPEVSVVISEEDGFNNTLSHGLCYEFQKGSASDVGDDNKEVWGNVFLPPIQARLNADLLKANLTQDDTLYLLEMCPFNTVAHPLGHLSPFCDLFTEEEFRQYGYYASLDKWYGYSNGNPFGSTQGVGFTNELIARMTQKPVKDHTSTNSTLDSNPKTFPLDRALYADFSHDNDMAGVFAALGLYNSTNPLSNSSLETIEQTNGYSAAWTVPFGARAYFEKMKCFGYDDELVRVVINDRVIPLETCGADELGRCTLDAFVESLDFARQGGLWDQCGTWPDDDDDD